MILGLTRLLYRGEIEHREIEIPDDSLLFSLYSYRHNERPLGNILIQSKYPIKETYFNECCKIDNIYFSLLTDVNIDDSSLLKNDLYDIYKPKNTIIKRFDFSWLNIRKALSSTIDNFTDYTEECLTDIYKVLYITKRGVMTVRLSPTKRKEEDLRSISLFLIEWRDFNRIFTEEESCYGGTVYYQKIYDPQSIESFNKKCDLLCKEFKKL